MGSKYSREKRLEIGKEIYERRLTVNMAAVKYGINMYTARDYLRMYKATINAVIPPNQRTADGDKNYEEMSRNELLDEVMRLRNALNAKEKE